MALHLNLYHEVVKQRRAQSRDPLKLSMIALGLVVSAFAGYYFWQLGVMNRINHEFQDQKAEFERLQPKAEAAQARQIQLEGLLKTGELLEKRIEGRFYWAPILEQFATVVPPQVQIRKLSGDLQGRKCTIILEGSASGADPRKTAEDLRTQIATELAKKYDEVSSIYRNLETEGTQPVVLEGKTYPTASFIISVQLSAKEYTPKR